MSGDDRRADGGEHPLDVDARFADIIAHFHDGEPSKPTVVGYDETYDESPTTADDADPDPGPAEDAGAPDDLWPTTGTTETPERDPVIDVPADLVEARDERLARIEAEIERAVRGADGGHYVPPEPPPIPRPDLPGRLAWGAVLLGPVLLVLCAVLWDAVRAPSWFLGAIVTAMVAGFAYLVWGLPRTRDREDPDDGAIV